MTAFQEMLLSFLFVVLLLTGVYGERRSVVVTERTSRSSSASASASASASSSSSVTTYVTTEDATDEAQPEVPKKEKPVEHKAPVKPSPKNVTERIRDAILNGGVEEISWILVDETDITELANGFIFPEEKREKYLITTPERKTDPDVIALKGMAKAAVDHGIAKKLTDIFIVAIYGADFENNLCPEEPQVTSSKTVKQNRTVTTTTFGQTKITNASGTYIIHDEPQTETKFWENSYTTDGIDLEMEEEAVASLEAEEYDALAECHTEEEILTVRERLLTDFSDKKLMKEIVEGHPKPKGWRRRSRALYVIGTPVSGWICAECWKPKFCNKNVYWCPQ